MIISINWLKKYTNITLPVDELATLIGARLVEIEGTRELGHKYESTYVVKIIDCKPVEGTDHLNVTKIDDGGVVEDVDRDENGFIQVVCGAPNVRVGLVVAWLPPGSTVPETVDSSDPFVLTPKDLRGTISNGMLASAKELDLFEDHTGILELSDELTIGSQLSTALELDDTLLDIENKSLTHRPDTFGIIGFAREVAAIQDLAFLTPDWLRDIEPDYGDRQGDLEALAIDIENPDLSARYQSVVLSGADSTKQSPVWVQTYLSRVGVRPINAVVDVTNYLMMLTGQPLHAFDYDKVVALAGDKKEIHVRNARENETLELLDGRTIQLDEGDIVIAAGDTAIGLAGAMGGANTVIDENTTNIIVESATFNLYSLRSTQMRHGIFSEAITRFTKGQPAGLTAPVLAEAIRLLNEWSGARRVSEIVEAYPGRTDPLDLTVTKDDINHLLGTELTVSESVSTLEHIEFVTTNVSDTSFTVTAPYWRSDIHIIQDVIEEVGRLRGFDNITPTLPGRDFTAVNPTKFDELRSILRKVLVRSGANEVLTYSFIHGDILKKAHQNPDNSYRIINSISPDLQYYRQSLTPSLMSLVYPNVKQGYDTFSLFELNKVHQKAFGLTPEDVPTETNMLAVTLTNKKNQTTSPYYLAKDMIDYIAESLGLQFIYEKLQPESDDATLSPFEPRRSAIIKNAASGAYIGVVGEYKRSVVRAFKLSDYSAGFEVNTLSLFEAAKTRTVEYVPLSKYPASERDICFQVEQLVSYEEIIESIKKPVTQLPVSVVIAPLDLYQPEAGTTKNITIRLQFTSLDKTLTGDEVSSYVDSIAHSVIDSVHATII
jgi:phenylalanyl-tRNA synthetase beta chain